ncbi:hypothetical protein Ocin01_02941 [Orchesella cincta]|uniref:Uncharacterized protein n=1 Tax=Orchesella cincta TaxID=48709 RepID=A0A1D2NET3_ORCCI|nr:hypothetical protein Ocin01_02941 [Orchesella cincta]
MEEQLTMEDEEEGGVEVEVESDEDIYGDLESDIFFPPTKRAKQILQDVQDEEHEKILKENQRLRAKLTQLNKENKTYSSNISALYLTAKNEIEKKNFIIKNLQEKLKTITQSKSALSKEAVDEIITKCHEALLETQAQVTLDEIKKSLEKASVLKDSKRKRIKFGNMSVYFFREQGCFQRQETVEFPKSSTQTSSTTSEDQTQRLVDHNHEASQSSQSSRVSNPADMRIKPPRQSPSVVSNISNPTRPTSLSITAENSIVPGGRSKRNSSSNRSGSGERPGGFDNRRRLSSEQENNNKVDDDRPPNKRSDYRSNRDYSPSAEKHNTRTNRGGTRGKGADYKDNHRSSDYRSRTSKRFSTDSRHSDKRHRSRSR